MLLLKLPGIVSGYHLNTYITIAQLIAANTGHARSLIESLRFCDRTMPYWGRTASLAIARTTRAKTYMTICWFTEEILPEREGRPKTR